MAAWAFLWEYKSVILFYAAIALLIYLNRKKIDIQGKIVFLYRTKWGLDLMDRLGRPAAKEKLGERTVALGLAIMGAAVAGILVGLAAKWLHASLPPLAWVRPAFALGFVVFSVGMLFRPVKLLGRVGTVLGFAGMAVVTIYLLYEFNKLFTAPEAPAAVVPAIPGVRIPGSPIFIPFWYGILALFCVVVVHEAAHGIVARAHNIKIKSSGLVMFGPIPGAFVEPEEEELKKRPASTQNAVFAAGPFANLILAVAAILLLGFVFDPLLEASATFGGVTFAGVQVGCPAAKAQVQPGVVYTRLDGIPLADQGTFFDAIGNLTPGGAVTLANENLTHTIVSVPHPENASRAFLGVTGVSAVLNPVAGAWWYLPVLILSKFLFWVFLLSQGIGLINLLPVGPIDGGRMFHQASLRLWGKRGIRVWTAVSLVLVFILAALLISSLVKGIWAPPPPPFTCP